jgi:hypothetical protein
MAFLKSTQEPAQLQSFPTILTRELVQSQLSSCHINFLVKSSKCLNVLPSLDHWFVSTRLPFIHAQQSLKSPIFTTKNL